MKKWIRCCAFLLAASLLLSGCALKTLDELYCLPKRSRTVSELQEVIDAAMNGLEYCAPQSGENRQVIQSADLDGDGVEEHLVLAKDDSEKPLKILIFCQLASGYVLMDTIEGYGFGFDFVTLRQMDDRAGLEIIVGRRVSEEVVRSVSVYRFSSGIARHMLTTGYSRVLTVDSDRDGVCELFLLNQSLAESGIGRLLVYAYRDEQMQRIGEQNISSAGDGYKQLTFGALNDGSTAIYVTCTDDDTLVTDVFAIDDLHIRPVSTQIRTEMLQDFYVYPSDMDQDGILELPKLLSIPSNDEQPQNLVVWYSLDQLGNETEEKCTYHNFADNWFLEIPDDLVGLITAEREGTSCRFGVYDPETNENHMLFTITTLMDADRNDLAIQPGRVVLFSTDSVIYVADITELAAEYHVTSTSLTENFRTIRVDLNNEEE